MKKSLSSLYLVLSTLLVYTCDDRAERRLTDDEAHLIAQEADIYLYYDRRDP